MKKQTVIEMPYDELEALVQQTYNLQEWSFVADQEMGNDSAKTFVIKGKEPLDTYDAEKLTEFMANPINNWMTSRLLQDLVNRDKLEPGKYLIEVCW